MKEPLIFKRLLTLSIFIVLIATVAYGIFASYGKGMISTISGLSLCTENVQSLYQEQSGRWAWFVTMKR